MNQLLVIDGVGAVGSYGHSITRLASSLSELQAPSFHVPFAEEGQGPLTDTSAIRQYLHPKQLRQVDHFTRLALLSSFYALENATIEISAIDNMGIILVSGYGPLQRTFDFLGSIIDFGPSMASPLMFSLSVHNIPAATIALLLQQQSSYTTICQPEGAVFAGLQTAQLWLQQKRVTRVLLIAVDEYNSAFGSLSSQLHSQSNPKSTYPLPYIVAESAVCLCLSLAPAPLRNQSIITNLQKLQTTSNKIICKSSPLQNNITELFCGHVPHELQSLDNHKGIVPLQLPTAHALAIALAASFTTVPVTNEAPLPVQCTDFGLHNTRYIATLKSN